MSTDRVPTPDELALEVSLHGAMPIVEHDLTLLPRLSMISAGPHTDALFQDARVVGIVRRMQRTASGEFGYPTTGEMERVIIRSLDRDGAIQPYAPPRVLHDDELLYPERSGFDPALSALARAALLEVHVTRATMAFALASSLVSPDDDSAVNDGAVNDGAADDGADCFAYILRHSLVVLRPDSFLSGRLLEAIRAGDAQRDSFLDAWTSRPEIGQFFVAKPGTAHEHVALARGLAQDHTAFLSIADGWLMHFTGCVRLQLPEQLRSNRK